MMSDLKDMLRLAAVRMSDLQLSPASSGNVSVRNADGFLITPSAMRYEDCRAEDMVQVGFDGVIAGCRRPSSEWHMHAAIYQARDDAAAILHAHSPWCTTLACLGRSIPGFHYMVALAGGSDIPCSPYAPFGTQALADTITPLMQHRDACLMGNHGMICLSSNLDSVLQLAQEVEHLAQVYCQALQIGEPKLLSDTQMNEAVAAFSRYRKVND